MMTTNTVYLALGTNQGDRESLLKRAIKMLADDPRISITDHSSIYETDPVGYVEQPKFLNMVLKLNTSLRPTQLLDFTQEIEEALGRKRSIRWGPRTIDLDILLFNNENIKSERLIIPHPRMIERAFVMVPLLEINEGLLNIYSVDAEEFNNKRGLKMYIQRDEFTLSVNIS